MRQSERLGVLIGMAGLGLALVSATRTASAATPPSPYAPQGGAAPPASGGGTQVTYGTFAGPVRGNPDVWRAQRQLEALGYDPRGDDGLFGPDTRRALNDFQRDYGQPVTATLTAAAIAGVEQEYARIAPPGATADVLDGLPAAAGPGAYRCRY